MQRTTWIYLLLAALISVGTFLGVVWHFQAEDRATRESCAQGKVWACPTPPAR